jgi:XTP/dITP diphosphohydrolase
MIKAARIQEKAANVGFDWEERGQVWDKVREETEELRHEIDALNPEQMEAEMGDLLFSLINVSRLYGINPENALEKTNRKFIRRFNYVEQRANQTGRNIRNMTLDEMDELWNEAKRLERQ